MNFLRLLKDNLSLGQDDDAPDRINYKASAMPQQRTKQKTKSICSSSKFHLVSVYNYFTHITNYNVKGI